MTPSPTRVAELARLLPERVAAHYGEGPRVAALRRALEPFATDDRGVTPHSLREVEIAGKRVFGHLDLSSASNLTPQERSPGWPPDDVAAAQREGALIDSVRRSVDGVAVLRLTGLAVAAAAAPLLAGAFHLMQHASTIVLDLRRNGGGDPATLVLIVDWLAAGRPRHLFDVRYSDRIRQWWSAAAPVAPPPMAPVVAVIGQGTYSSGEALAWVLQRQRLATLVGEPTPGAADHVVPLAVTHDVQALIPEATVVDVEGGPTWEGTGVQPDHRVRLDADEALDLPAMAEFTSPAQ